MWTVWPLFLGCLPVHLRSARPLQIEGGEFSERLLDTPRGLLVSAALVGAGAFVLSAHGIFTAPGVPERHGSLDHLRDHTELTPVSRAQHRYAERMTERIFAGGALIFYLLGIVIHVSQRQPERIGGLAAGP
ncbi:MAG: hypothetical protein M3R39_04205 [Actinomycetota bacterium]|nr:hypothetical protein [Actinomycetota bacterium]